MSELQQRTLVIVKPDGVARSLVGTIVGRLEQKGFSLVGLKLVQVSEDLAGKHYAEHKSKPFFGSLVEFITAGPAVVMAVEGPNAAEVVRGMVGPTNGRKAPAGTIRGDFSISMQNNLIHASDSPESAARELELWFKADELVKPGKGSGMAAYAWVHSAEDRNK